MSLARTKRDFLAKGKITIDEYRRWKKDSNTKINKFLHWMVSQWLLSEKIIDPKILIQTAEGFYLLVKKGLLKKDIYNYSFKDLFEEIESKKDLKSRSEEKRESKIDGAELLAKKGSISLYKINSYRACAEYGKGTKWCIASRSNKDWIKYTKEELAQFYFIISQNLPTNDPDYKIAIMVRPYEFNESGRDILAYNSQNHNIYLEGYLEDQGIESFKSLLLPLSQAKVLDLLEKEREAIISKSRWDEKAQGYHYRGNLDLSRRIKAFGANSIKEYLGPIKLLSVSKGFHCCFNNLRSLEGAPLIVKGSFYCTYNRLRSLRGSPKRVGFNFFCSGNQLSSLKGCPEVIPGGFDSSSNILEVLKGGPKIVRGSFNISQNLLESLEGCPPNLASDFFVNHNLLESLKGGPKNKVMLYNCSYNRLKSLEGAPKDVLDDFNASHNNLRSLKGSPRRIEGNFNISYNELSLESLKSKERPKIIGGEILFHDCMSSNKFNPNELN